MAPLSMSRPADLLQLLFVVCQFFKLAVGLVVADDAAPSISQLLTIFSDELLVCLFLFLFELLKTLLFLQGFFHNLSASAERNELFFFSLGLSHYGFFLYFELAVLSCEDQRGLVLDGRVGGTR